MAVTQMTISCTRPKRKPCAGDEKTIDGVVYVREFERTACGAINKTGGRYHYVWVKKGGAA